MERTNLCIKPRGKKSHEAFKKLMGVQYGPFVPKYNSLICLTGAYFSLRPVKTLASPPILRKARVAVHIWV